MLMDAAIEAIPDGPNIVRIQGWVRHVVKCGLAEGRNVFNEESRPVDHGRLVDPRQLGIYNATALISTRDLVSCFEVFGREQAATVK